MQANLHSSVQNFEPKPLYQLLLDTVHKFPNHDAVDFYGNTLTYSDIFELAENFSAYLVQQGLKKGDKVGILLPNCPQFIAAYYGILMAGCTVVNFSPLYSPKELLFQAQDAEIKVMVSCDLKQIFENIHQILPESKIEKLLICKFSEALPAVKGLMFKLVRGDDVAEVPYGGIIEQFEKVIARRSKEKFHPVDIQPEQDVAVIQYTGGTTGTPKGALLTHANLYINTQQCREVFSRAQDGSEVIMGVLPFFHVFSMTAVMNLGIRLGACILLAPKFDLKACLKDIEYKKPSLFPGVPTIFSAIAHHPKSKLMDLSSIKFCISGGAPLPVEVKNRFEDLTGCILVEGYGLSETSPVASCNPLFAPQKTASIGYPVPGTEIVIKNPEPPYNILPPYEKGELCIKGPQVMLGYHHRPEETSKTIIDGYLHTGDLGYKDSDGYIFIVDRKKDLIISGGFNIYPRQLEEAIYLHPAVEEVIVIGIPDLHRGEVPKAYIKLRDGKTCAREDILEHCRLHLGKHEIPKEVEFRSSLPKTMIGKLSKKELRDELNKA